MAILMIAGGVRTLHEAALSAAAKALFDHAVGEARAHVQGESLKACAAFLVKLLNSPITRGAYMLCEFCKGEISDLASICQFCNRATPLGRDSRREKQGVVFVAIVGVVVIAVLFVVMVVSTPLSTAQRNPAEAIKQSCEAQFGAGTQESQNCFLAVAMKRMEAERARKLHDADAASQ